MTKPKPLTDSLLFWTYAFNATMHALIAVGFYYTGRPYWLMILYAALALFHFVMLFTFRNIRFWIGVLFRSLKGEP